MELMYQPYLELVENCIQFARQFLSLPEQIHVYFDDCPSQRFPASVNAAESNSDTLYFNKEWMTGQDRWDNHKDDIEFFVFHELRHMHQFFSIHLLKNGLPCNENETIVREWEYGFSNYTRNVGGSSQDINVTQEVEIDANAYAVCLTNLYHINDNKELRFSAPENAMALAMERSSAYYAQKPELKKYIDMKRAAIQQKQQPIRKTKIGRNEPCPCGSGKKFKKCDCKAFHSE